MKMRSIRHDSSDYVLLTSIFVFAAFEDMTAHYGVIMRVWLWGKSVPTQGWPMWT